MTHFGGKPEGQPVNTGRDARPALDEPARFETVLDVDTQRIARVYAEALYRAAAKRNQVDELLDELESLTGQLFKAHPQFEAFLASGVIGRDRKAGVIRSAFANRASELLLHFLLVLNDHERLDVLQPIVTAYRDLRDEKAGRLHIQVRSAVPLPDEQRERLRQELREAFDKEPVLETETDAELIGGMVVRVDDWVYDHSVRTQLETIRNQLIARSSYEIQSRRDRFGSPDGD
jgi:F-type H+-transporting ATPase subunit delta